MRNFATVVMFVVLSLSLDGMDEPRGRKRSNSDSERASWGHTIPIEIIRGTIFTGFQRCMEQYFKGQIYPDKLQIFRTNYVDYDTIPDGVCGDLLRNYISAWYGNIKAHKYGRQKVGGPELFRNEKNELFFC